MSALGSCLNFAAHASGEQAGTTQREGKEGGSDTACCMLVHLSPTSLDHISHTHTICVCLPSLFHSSIPRKQHGPLFSSSSLLSEVAFQGRTNVRSRRLGRGFDEALFSEKKGVFSEKWGRHSVNEEFGKDFYKKRNSVKRSGPFNEPPDSESGKVAVLIPFRKISS